jgi:hypothetical protein
VTDVQRTGRVRGHEFDEHAFTRHRRGCTVGDAEFVDARQFQRARGGLTWKVDEAGAGDLGALDEIIRGQCRDDGLRKLARTAAGGLGEPHRDVGRKIAVLRIAGALNGDLGGLGGGR